MALERVRSALGTDPFVAAAERPLALLAVLWGTGGVLALGWGLGGVGPDGSVLLVLGIGLFASLLGGTLWVSRSRVLPDAAHVALVLIGTVAICGVLYGTGGSAAGPPTILFVYIGVFAFIAVPRPILFVILPSVLAHAALLWVMDNPELPATLVMIWGAVLVAGLLVGQATVATRRVTAERERLLAELRDADETKTAFLHAVGHDLTAPAASLVGLADLLEARDDDLDPALRQQMVGRLAANARRLHEDLAGLIRFEELSTGRVDVRRDPVRTDVLVTRAVERAGVPVDRVVTREVESFVFPGDAAKLEHALANLIGNAERYAGQAGPIEVSTTRRQGRALLTVDDRGPGIPTDQQERIFEPLARAREQDVGHGSGIGLSLVRAFARLHGGDAWVEPRPGGGARFRFAIPLEPAGAPSDRGVRPPA
ncbi:MAG: hypothetical protein JJT89_13990 [Nitriliruptoraceae bacterium]|nr:hypothetical protein [Nitriliruptoraceae bacterium]